MTPEQERAHEIKRITIMISELIENDQPSEEIARQVIVTINRNSLDREEQLITENERLDQKNDVYIEKSDKQRKEIEGLEDLVRRQKIDIKRLLKMVDELDFDDEINRLRSVVAEQDKEIQRLSELLFTRNHGEIIPNEVEAEG